MLYRNDGPLDAEAGAFFEDELVSIDQRVLEDERAPLNGFQVIPQNNSTAGTWDDQYEERSMQLTGIAEFLGDEADDIPLVDAALRADRYNIRTFACAYKYTIMEIEKAREVGRPLQAWRARAANVAIQEKHNRIMWYGDQSTQLFGLLNNPFANRFFFDDPIGDPTANDTVLSQINAMLTVPFDVTETIARIDFLGLPPTQFRHIMTTPLQTGQDTTIAEHLVKSNPGLTMDRIQPIRELRGAGSTGQDLVIAFETNEDVLKHNVAMLFRRFPPLAKVFKWLVPTMGRSGGVSMRQPRKVVIGELP